MAGLAAALLMGALAAPLAVQAQAPPFPTPLPGCYYQPDPATDVWPRTMPDSLGSTAGVPVTFAGATLAANDVAATALTVSRVGPTSALGGAITGTDPYTFTPSAPGDDSFPYEITDTAGRATMGIVRISVAADVILPTVSITSPTGGPVSGSVLIRASASDNVGVTGVTFFDGVAPISTVSSAPFETAWATTLVANGSHSLTAVARDAAGNTATSSAVVVNVSNVVMVTVPGVVGLAQASAVSAITGATLTASSTTANSPTAAIGSVISQSPVGGTSVATGTNVALVVSVGALVPGVVGSSQAAATTAITAAGLVVGTTNTTNNAAAAGTVISQSPAAGTNAAPGSAMTITVSLGPAATTVIVPGVVNLTQAAATTAITGAGLTVGAVTTATSSTVASGRVISQTPVGGTSALIGSAVALVVSSGPPAPPAGGLVLAFGFEEASGTTAVDSAAAPINGTIREAVRVATGRIGRALRFDGANDWVTVIDGVTGSKLDLTTGMTMEAWVNPTAMSGWETVVMKERGVGNLSYALYAHDGAPLAGGFAGPAGYLRPAPAASTTDQGVRGAAHTPLALNTWTHVATTYDGASQRLYVNGVLVATKAQTGAVAAGNQPLRIGGNSAFTGEFFQGLIDEVRIYNRALSAAEITTDMTTPVVP